MSELRKQEPRNTDMVIISKREVGQGIKRKESFVDFMILHNMSPGWMWQESRSLPLMDLQLILPAWSCRWEWATSNGFLCLIWLYSQRWSSTVCSPSHWNSNQTPPWTVQTYHLKGIPPAVSKLVHLVAGQMELWLCNWTNLGDLDRLCRENMKSVQKRY